VPAELLAGQAAEARQLGLLNLAGNNTVFRPTADQINSAAFNVIVGEARYTPSGLPVGTAFDSLTAGFSEIKTGQVS
jgi:filamentous hemagglutinin